MIIHSENFELDEIDSEWAFDQIWSLIDEKISIKISEFAEQKRILPKGTPFPGPWDNTRTPYLIEPMDNLGDISDVEYEIWLKGHQLGFTSAVENAILYIIEKSPAPILYTTASDQLGKEWSETRFDQMIEQAGIQNLIFSQTVKKNSKKTGDKTLLKEFPGGKIKITGYGSPASLRSSSFRYFFGDEIDEAKADLKKQGDAIGLAKARTSAYKSKRKICIFSTPTEKDLSKIYAAYLLGDQRKFKVPCPYCGTMQFLEFDNLKYEIDAAGSLIHESVKYKCAGCGDFFYNHHKSVMYKSGKCYWEPTAKAKIHNYVSRQMSCLYSPPGMITWTDVVQEYLSALNSGDPAKMKAFVTLYLGMPYEETGERPEYHRVITHRSNYKSRSVPDGVLFITLGADVQGDRIELEVCGHGRQFKTWSIEYVVIDGNTESVTAGAWPKFREKFLEGYFVYKNAAGKRFAPQMAFIDSHYREPTVVSFCETVTGLYPIIGQNKFSDHHQKFKINSKAGSNIQSFVLAVDYVKDIIYASLKTERDQATGKTPVGYSEFPFDYPDSYFEMLNSEYKRAIKKGSVTEYEYYCPSGKRNEALDAMVYNISARQVLFYTTINETLKESIEGYEKKMRRKITPAEKTEFFYGYMEKIGSF